MAGLCEAASVFPFLKAVRAQSAVPMCELCAGFVGALAEIEKRLVGPRRSTHVVVLEDELSQLRVPVRRVRVHRFLAEALGSGDGVGVESRVLNLRSPGQKPQLMTS